MRANTQAIKESFPAKAKAPEQHTEPYVDPTIGFLGTITVFDSKVVETELDSTDFDFGGVSEDVADLTMAIYRMESDEPFIEGTLMISGELEGVEDLNTEEKSDAPPVGWYIETTPDGFKANNFETKYAFKDFIITEI